MPDRIRVACVQMTSGRDKDANLARAEALVARAASTGADPWGIGLAQAPDDETVIVVELDRARVREIRAKLPSLANRRAGAYRWPTTSR